MPMILLDGHPLTVDAEAISSWGRLLETVDRQLSPSQLIVTDVSFDGIDEPAFRDPAVLGRQLADLATVAIGSGTPAELMTRCLGDAVAAIDPLCQASLAVGELFRGTDLASANRGLVEVAEGLTTLTSIVGAAGLALKVDLNDVAYGDRSALAAVNELTALVEQVIGAQQRADWIALADILQYDIEPALRGWGPLLETFVRPVAPVA